MHNTSEWMRQMMEQLNAAHDRDPLYELFVGFQPMPDNDWKYKGTDGGNHVWTFTVDGKHYTTRAWPFQGDMSTLFGIEFSLEAKNPVFHTTSTPGDSSTVTKGAASVFELVAYSLADLFKHATVNGLFFTADEPSRQKLYNVLAQKISKKLGWIRRDDIGEWINKKQGKEFLIVKPSFLKDVLEPAFDADDMTRFYPKPARQPDTFGALPIRMD